jgi:DNA gyrase/topoisomerase IV subunit B
MTGFGQNVRILDGIAAVRLRPAMYLGSTDFFGFIHYLVEAVSLIISHRPTRIAVCAREGAFQIASDIAIPIDATANGRLAPFEDFMSAGARYWWGGVVVNALSQSFLVEIREGARREVLEYRCGTRLSHQKTEVVPDGSRTTLHFVPDSSILTVTMISPAILTSYLRRLSFLYPGVRFTHSAGAETQEFYSERGIVDLFAGVSAPHQLLHEPIHILVEEGSTKLEAVFAYHSWTENAVWCFINNFRAVDGGTHEQGFLDALSQLMEKLELPEAREPYHPNGVIGIMSLQYPGAVWGSSTRCIIGNPELRGLVCNWVVEHTMEWIRSHPETAEQLRHLRTFEFPDAWLT